MFWKCVRAGLLSLLLFPAWSSVRAIEVPVPPAPGMNDFDRGVPVLELVPWTAPHRDPDRPAGPRPRSDEAIREKDPPRRAPFQYDVMPAEEDRDDLDTPRADVLDIRGA